MKVAKKIAIISGVFMIIVFIINLLFNGITDFSLGLRNSAEFAPVSSIITLVTGILALIMMIQVLLIKKKESTDVSTFLGGYFLFTGISAIINVIFSIFEFTVEELDVYFTASTYFFLCTGFIYLSLFNAEVFFDGAGDPKNKNKLLIVKVGGLIFSLYIFKDILLSSSSIELILFGIIFLFIAIWMYFDIVRSSAQLFSYFKKQQDKVRSLGFFFLMFSGIFLMSGFLVLFIFQIIRQEGDSVENWMNWSSLILLALGYIALFFGFIYPTKKGEKSKE